MDVLVHLVRGCGCEGGVLVTDVFPAVVQRVLSSEDSAILQVRIIITRGARGRPRV